MKEIKAIYFHKGEGLHLIASIMQLSNKIGRDSILLLGDHQNKYLDKYCNHFFYKKYMESANKFEKYYKHLSPNSYEFELICFQRWFIIRDLLKQQYNDQDYFVYFDSDTLININLNKFSNQLFDNGDIEMTVCGIGGPQFTFFKNYHAIDTFCNYLLNYYKQQNKKQELIDLWNNFYTAKEIDGGVCDMTLLYHYSLENKEKVLDLMKINNDTTFDGCAAQAQGFKFDGKKQLKDFYIENNKYFAHSQNKNTKVEFLGIHFQGNSKKYILEYYLGPKKYMLKYFYQPIIRFKNLLRKIKRRLWIYKKNAK